jgi:hypothetical protein
MLSEMVSFSTYCFHFALLPLLARPIVPQVPVTFLSSPSTALHWRGTDLPFSATFYSPKANEGCKSHIISNGRKARIDSLVYRLHMHLSSQLYRVKGIARWGMRVVMNVREMGSKRLINDIFNL